MRKALTVSKNNFANEKLLSHLVPVVIETMNSGYPEIANKQNAILEIIEHEREVYSALRKSSREAFAEVISESSYTDDADLIEYAGFIPAYRDLKLSKVRFKNVIPGDFLYKLTSTYGLTEEHFEILANLEGMMCDLEGYHKALSEAKLRSKLSVTKDTTLNDMTASIEETLIDLTKTLPATQNQHIYNYQYDTETKQYSIPSLRAKVLGILYNDVNVKEVVCNGVIKSIDMISIITDASNFYVESGGQQSDKGYLVVDSSTASPNMHPRLGVVGTHLINDCVVHTCKLPEQKSNFTLAVGDEVMLTVDENRRTGNIRHHTGIKTKSFTH